MSYDQNAANLKIQINAYLARGAAGNAPASDLKKTTRTMREISEKYFMKGDLPTEVYREMAERLGKPEVRQNAKKDLRELQDSLALERPMVENHFTAVERGTFRASLVALGLGVLAGAGAAVAHFTTDPKLLELPFFANMKNLSGTLGAMVPGMIFLSAGLAFLSDRAKNFASDIGKSAKAVEEFLRYAGNALRE